MKRIVLASFAVLAMVMTGTGPALAKGPYPPPSKGTGHVEPSRIKAGECAVFSGDGFAPATPVAVSDNGQPRGTTTTRSDGTFSITLCYSTTAKRGRHDLAGSGTGANGSPLTVYAVLIVEGVRQSPGGPKKTDAQAGSAGANGSSSQGGPTASNSEPGAVSAGPDLISGGPYPTRRAVGSASSVPVFGEDLGMWRLVEGALILFIVICTAWWLLLLARRRRDHERQGLPASPALA